MQFAKPGDPLVREDGSKMLSDDNRSIDLTTNIPNIQRVKSKIQRSVRDLPASAQTQTVVNAVLVYHLLGVSRNEIAYTLSTSIDQIDEIFRLPAFQETFEMLHSELISVNSGSIHARLQKMANAAVDNLFELANTKPHDEVHTDDNGNEYTKKVYAVPPVVIMKSNDSILDRASIVGEQEFRNQQHDTGGGLEIVIHSGNENATDVKINVNRGR